MNYQKPGVETLYTIFQIKKKCKIRDFMENRKKNREISIKK